MQALSKDGGLSGTISATGSSTRREAQAAEILNKFETRPFSETRMHTSAIMDSTGSTFAARRRTRNKQQ